MLVATDYGPFTNLVATAGSIMAMVFALGLGWRHRSRWEPTEEDISGAPQRVGSLVAGTAIAIIFVTQSAPESLAILSRWTIRLLIVTVLSLVVYGLLVSTLTYYVEDVDSAGKIQERNIVGGFWLARGVREKMQQANVTVQEFLKGTSYKVDAVWPRLSRGLAKQTFVLAYLGLTICGTIALACAAIVVGLKR